MDSRKPNRFHLFFQLTLNLSGKAVFSLKNDSILLTQYSGAGVTAGVFFGYGKRLWDAGVTKMAEALHPLVCSASVGTEFISANRGMLAPMNNPPGASR
jgi:hypothetical protein